MKGLLLKELYLMKATGKSYLFLIVLYVALSFINGVSFLSVMTAVIAFILPMTTFAADELARWDKFAAALPGGRRAVVKAKYQFLFLTLGCLFLLVLAVDLVMLILRRTGDDDLGRLLLTAVIALLVSVLLNCIEYPILFKFGTQKSRLIMAILMGIICALAGIMIALLLTADGEAISGWARLLPTSLPVIAAGVIILTAGATALSYRVSCRIYDKKEF